MIKLYGIKNCNTVKNALNWLNQHHISFTFYDYKKEGIDLKQMEKFLQNFGQEKLINRKGTTWKQLNAEQQNTITDNNSALKLMIEKPSIIKRPILDLGDKQLIGFDTAEYAAQFKK